MKQALVNVLTEFAETRRQALTESLGDMLEGELVVTGFVFRPADAEEMVEPADYGEHQWAAEVHFMVEGSDTFRTITDSVTLHFSGGVKTYAEAVAKLVEVKAKPGVTLEVRDHRTNTLLGLCENVHERDDKTLIVPRAMLLHSAVMEIKPRDLKRLLGSGQKIPFDLYEGGQLRYQECWWASWEASYATESSIVIEGGTIFFCGKALD